jgi:hypothetical protein
MTLCDALLLLLLLLASAVAQHQAWGGNGGAMQAAQVSSAMLTGLTVTDCYASAAGGAVSFLASTNVTLQSSTLFNNTAPLGAGLAADSSQLALRGVNISSNLAVEEEETEEGGRRRRRLQQAVRLEIDMAHLCLDLRSMLSCIVTESLLHSDMLIGSCVSDRQVDPQSWALYGQRMCSAASRRAHLHFCDLRVCRLRQLMMHQQCGRLVLRCTHPPLVVPSWCSPPRSA